jgi:hypothetical protein
MCKAGTCGPASVRVSLLSILVVMAFVPRGLAGGARPVVPAATETLLGVTWQDSLLVSFDPSTGENVTTHRALDPDVAYTGLAYDRNHHRLYAMPQDVGRVDVIDTDTLQTVDRLYLRIDPRVNGGSETVTLAYDPIRDLLYTVVGHWMNYPAGPIWSELATIDTGSGALTIVGRIDGPWISSLAFSETGGQLYGIGVSGADTSDSADPARILRIDPVTAEVVPQFTTPYHSILGLAVREPFSFFSWINWDEHSYGLTDLLTQTVTLLGSSDAAGAIVAMVREDFSLPQAPIPIPPEPESFFMQGVLTSVWDPGHHLTGGARAGRHFSAWLNYDAAAPFQTPDPNAGEPYGLTLIINGNRFDASGLEATIENDRYDPLDGSVNDVFSLFAQTAPSVDISWTLVDRTGRALQVGNRLPDSFDLSAWDTNRLTIAGYDECCHRLIYSLSGSVRRIGPATGMRVRPSRRVH